MIALLALSAVVAAVVYACARQMRPGPRRLLAFLIFIIPPAAMIGYLIIVGDQPLPGSKEIQPGDVYPGREVQLER